jgi:hypothetical protein
MATILICNGRIFVWGERKTRTAKANPKGAAAGYEKEKVEEGFWRRILRTYAYTFLDGLIRLTRLGNVGTNIEHSDIYSLRRWKRCDC